MWTEKHANALKVVFEALNNSGVPWLVLRNYEGLPLQNRSKDIDIGVKKGDFLKVFKIISESLKKDQFNLFTYTKFQNAWCFTFFNVTENLPCAIKIDIQSPFVCRGAKIIGIEDLFENKISYGVFSVSPKNYDGFMLWIKPLMTGGFIKDKYRRDILNAIENNHQEFFTLIEKKFGKSLLEKIKPILSKGDLDETLKFKDKMRVAGYLIALKRRPVYTLFSTIEHLYREIRRRLNRPKGSFIAFIGPDGSGKSTIVEHFREALSGIMAKDQEDVKILHFRPGIFPNLKNLLSGKDYNEAEEEFNKPHRASPAGILSSFLRLSYYWFDYVFGYWYFIRRHCISGKIFIFDRYFYDFIVDPFRSRIKLPDWIRYLFLKMTPKPDIVFVLNCDSETIYKRKKELPLAEIERQLKAYNKIAKRYSNFYVVDSNKPVDEIVNEISIEYIKRIAKQVEDI